MQTPLWYGEGREGGRRGGMVETPVAFSLRYIETFLPSIVGCYVVYKKMLVKHKQR